MKLGTIYQHGNLIPIIQSSDGQARLLKEVCALANYQDFSTLLALSLIHI